MGQPDVIVPKFVFDDNQTSKWQIVAIIFPTRLLGAVGWREARNYLTPKLAAIPFDPFIKWKRIGNGFFLCHVYLMKVWGIKESRMLPPREHRLPRSLALTMEGPI